MRWTACWVGGTACRVEGTACRAAGIVEPAHVGTGSCIGVASSDAEATGAMNCLHWLELRHEQHKNG
jgi:hypothetical protein